jgi:cytochrome c-type biogenesis protein
MSALNPALGFAAGALTILSPCVLPLVPLVLGSAAQRHRFGALAMAGGLVIAFTGAGLAVALLGNSIGLDGDVLKQAAAVMLMVIGIILLVPRAQELVTHVATPIAAWGQERQGGLRDAGLAGQFGLGALLGLVWVPCIGPTLGAATVLAAQGEDLGAVSLTMAAFAAGIATVLLLIAFASRSLLSRWQGALVHGGGRGKQVFGGVLLITGLLIFSGAMLFIEGWLVTNSPDWLIDLSTAL